MINTISIALGTVSFEMIVSYEGSKQYLVLKRRKRHSKELFFCHEVPLKHRGKLYHSHDSSDFLIILL